jgi:hypothetical protein
VPARQQRRPCRRALRFRAVVRQPEPIGCERVDPLGRRASERSAALATQLAETEIVHVEEHDVRKLSHLTYPSIWTCREPNPRTDTSMAAKPDRQRPPPSGRTNHDLICVGSTSCRALRRKEETPPRSPDRFACIGVIGDGTARTVDPPDAKGPGRRTGLGVPVPGRRPRIEASSARRVCFRAGRGCGAGARARAAAAGAASLEVADPRRNG